jgi:putative membrane protein
MPAIIVVCAYTALIVYIENTWLHLSEQHPLRHFGALQALLSFVISMLLVFRTNTAYDRWWEGRKHWGTLVNNSRNLAIKVNAMLPQNDTKNRSFFKKLIPLFAEALQQHLVSEKTRVALYSQPHPEIPEFDESKHLPNQIASLMSNKMNLLYKEGILSGEQMIILNSDLQSFTEVCGACERIKNTPIPYSYSTFIKKFIFVYTITLPFGMAYSLQYLLVPIVGFVFYVMASLEMIASEIEDPFGNDANDLPMKKMADNITKNVADILK